MIILPQTYIPDIYYHTVFQSKSRCSCTHEETHILDVEVKDFLHECGGHRDHHYISPVLTKGPNHDHPHIPKRKYFSRKSPSMKQCKHVFDSSYLLTHCTSIRQNFLLHCITFCKWLPNKPTHLFFSISLNRRKTLPLRSFSLLTGSNDRLARINSFCNCCHYRHHCLSSVFLFQVQTSSAETLGCSSGRSESRRNQRRHLWFLRSDSTPITFENKTSESIPD